MRDPWKWLRTRWHIAEMELDLGLRDEWPDDLTMKPPPLPDPRITTEFRR